MKWRDVALDLYLALHELDKLTAEGQCNCDGEYTCVNCQVVAALSKYKNEVPTGATPRAEQGDAEVELWHGQACSYG